MDRPRLLISAIGGPETASTRYRILAHASALERAGFVPRFRFAEWAERRGPTRRVRRLIDLLRDGLDQRLADLFLLHRKTFPPRFARLLPRQGRPLVFDFDDAIDLPPPGRAEDPRILARYRTSFEATVNAADLVLCGNRELARRLPHQRFAILPTPVDTRRFTPGALPPPEGPILGWVGISDNLRFLEELAEPLREIHRRHPGLKLVVVADRHPTLPGIPVEFRRWTLDEEMTCFRGIAIGLMPLDDTPWTRGKCAFKALQYMALGIPTVASPVGTNCEVIEDGVSGFLPADPRSWVEALDRLLSDPALRMRIGAAGRRVVERHYSLEGTSAQLIALLNDLLSTR